MFGAPADEWDIVSINEANFAFERSVILQFCPAITAGWFHFVVSLPTELDGFAVAGAVDGAREAIDSDPPADRIEQDVGPRHGHVIARRLDDVPPAPDAHAGAARSLGRRIRL